MKSVVRNMEPVFVDAIPGELDEGRIYVALRYRTITHKCACGCGVEVNTPLHPTGWAITYDGSTISLWPSVGNWSEECQSHYWIEKSRVHWARPWKRSEVLEERERRGGEIKEFYKQDRGLEQTEVDRARGVRGRGLLKRLVGWVLEKLGKRVK